jgi:coenzyme F420-reducing hydrogenase delta subunit
MKDLIQFIGLSPKRLRLEWIATSEGNKLAQVVRDFSQEVIQLGPSPLRKFKKTIQWEPTQKSAEALKA